MTRRYHGLAGKGRGTEMTIDERLDWIRDRSSNTLMADHIAAIRAEVAEKDAKIKTYLLWANCGGPASGKPCSVDGHEIFGPFFSETLDGPFMCELHHYRDCLGRAKTLIAEKDQRIAELEDKTQYASGMLEIHRSQRRRIAELEGALQRIQSKLLTVQCAKPDCDGIIGFVLDIVVALVATDAPHAPTEAEAADMGSPVEISLETRVADWVITRIGLDHMASPERAMRLLEESVELAQAEGLTESQVNKQVAHVFARPAGDPKQEAAGVAVCLLAWCEANGVTFDAIAREEITRIEAKPLDAIRGSLARKADADLVTVGFRLMQMNYEVDESGECPNCANPPHAGPCTRKVEA